MGYIKAYKVIKPFLTLEVDEQLKRNLKDKWEVTCKGGGLLLKLSMTDEAAENYVKQGLLAKVYYKHPTDRINELKSFVYDKIAEYKKTSTSVPELENVPEVVKAEAITTYSNMITLLTHIKDMLND